MNPPTYPARPANAGTLVEALRFPRPGNWAWEAKVNGWRTLIHIPTGTMFNRQLERLSIEREFDKALAELRRLDISEWLDCEAFERRHAYGRGSLVILDVPVPGLTYDQRRAMLHRVVAMQSCGEELLGEGDVRQLSQGTQPRQMWAALQARNKALGADFYEGLVAKRTDTFYPMQLRSASEEFAGWQKSRWDF